MNKRERVLAALEGRRPDQLPFTMWRHVYFQAQTARGLARVTLDFYRRYDPDLIVLTPGPYHMAEAWGAQVRSFSTDDVAPYLAEPTVARATDWRRLPELNLPVCSLQREIEAVRQIRAEPTSEDAPLIVPLFSPLTTADLLCNGRIVQDMRSYSNDLRSALGVIAAGTIQYALACLAAGADGFIFVIHLASSERIRSREQRDFGQRFDLQVLSALDQAAIRILHLAGEHADFALADRYPVQAVCWDTWRADPSLRDACRQVRCTLMGGLNPTTFVGGSRADIRAQILDAVSQTEGWRLLIAPSGPLPIESRDELLAAVRQILQEQ